MALPAVNDDQTDQNFRELERRFPVREIANKVVTDAMLVKPTIVGQVSSGGAVVLGSGFTSEKTGTGVYKITLATELATDGVLVALPAEFNRVMRNSAGGKKTFTVNSVNLAEVAADTAFNFHIKAS